MIKFIADIIDQLDFVVDHLAMRDVNYKRLSLMLIDNVMEIFLHQFASEKGGRYGGSERKAADYQKALAAALGQRFDAKVAFAKIAGLIDERTAKSITTLHGYRNRLYHQGRGHEKVLHPLAVFYFQLACDVLARYESSGFSWSNKLKIPHRAIKYIGSQPFYDANKRIPLAWITLKEVSKSIGFELAQDLSADVEETITENDELLEYLTEGHPDKLSRDQVVVDVQAWHVAFTEKGKKFAEAKGRKLRSVQDYVEWLIKEYPLRYQSDPIPEWKRRLKSLRTETDLHKALEKYEQFMTQTKEFADALSSSAEAFDQMIESQIEAARLETAMAGRGMKG